MTWTLTHSIVQMRNSLRGGHLRAFSSTKSLGKSSIIDNRFGRVRIDLVRTFMLICDRHLGNSFHRIEKFWSVFSRTATKLHITKPVRRNSIHIALGFVLHWGTCSDARVPFLANN